MRTVTWQAGALRLIDQRHLPFELAFVDCQTYEEVATAIHNMTVRGAPAIGAAAAFGMAQAAQTSPAANLSDLIADLESAADHLRAARPTAVNLAWAVDQQLACAREAGPDPETVRAALLTNAQAIADDDVAANRRIGQNGAPLIREGATVLHHCNTGALATVDYGTALGVIRAAHEDGRDFHVLLDETRPRLQGSRLSAWELEQLGVSYEILPDSAAAYYMRRGEVDLILVGADRIAANGDVANKIGTYSLAVLAAAHALPFYSVAPLSTVDLHCATGDEIPIEERDAGEVLAPYGQAIAPAHFRARNPAFDITPARYLSGIITDRGIARAPFTESLARLVAEAESERS